MEYKISLGPWGDIFPVPCAVVDEQLKLCSGLQLKVLLHILRSSSKALDIAATAALLCVSQEAVTEAAEYWQATGVFSAMQQAPEPVVGATAAFVATAREGTAATLISPPQQQATPAQPANLRQHMAQSGQQVQTTSQSRFKITPAEVRQMAKRDLNIPLLLEEAQALLGKVLSPGETDVLLYLYSYMGLSPQYIFTLLTYCVNREKTSLRYIEKTAAAWVDKGIDTPEKAEAHMEHLRKAKEYEALVRAAFGLHDRALSTKEQEYITAWSTQLSMSLEMLKLAYDRTVDNTGKLAFAYIDKILRQWHTKGIATPKAAIEEMRSGKGSKAATTGKKETSYDLDKINNLVKQGNIM